MKILKPLAVAFLLPATFMTSEAKISAFKKEVSSEVHQILRQDTLKWEAPLPFDQSVKVGKLKNGFTYYIRRNVEPEKRVTMYLGVKAGSILEKDNEAGLAHFLEHMNFNGLKHFPKNDLVDYLQKAGVKFGSDLNAYTGFEETVYQLPIPSDDPELLKNGLQVMRDWAQDALLTDEEIDKERGVIMEEMRGGRGANQRMREQFFPVLLNNSLYSNRLPIGTEEVVMGFKHQLIRDFHARWYRPDLQSIIIVGDIDPVAIEKDVIRLFSDMKVQKKPVERKKFTVGLLNKNQYKVVTDPEMPQTVVQIFIKHPMEQVKTVGDYRNAIIKGIYVQLVNARLAEIGQKPDAPYLQGSISLGGLLDLFQAMTITVVPKPDQLENSTKAVIRELKRFEQFGATQTELQRAISMYAKSNESQYIERDKANSSNFVNKYLNHFLKDNSAMSIEDTYRITKQILPTVSLKEVNAVGDKYYAEINRDIIILAPEKDKDKIASESDVNAWFASLNAEKLTKYEDKVSELPLLPNTPVKGEIKSSREIASIEAKELTLSNGVKVILKPTTFKNNEILIDASSEGGSSLYDDADYFSASNAAGIVASSGVGNLNTVELRKYLAGKRVGIQPYLSERREGISASSDKEGLNTVFELIHGYFTAPRLDDEIFQTIIAKTIASMENREDEPDFVFQEAINKTLYGDNIRRNSASPEQIKSIDKDRTLQVFKERFSNAADFTFTIVGSFTEEEIRPLLEQYVASLPSTNSTEQARDLKILPPAKGVETVVKKGKEAKAQVNLSYLGDYVYDEVDNVNMDALESVLSIKLLERLREEEGGVYGTGAGVSYSKYPTPRFSVGIGFGTGLDKYQSLIASALDEIKKIKENGPTQVDLDKFKIEKIRENEVNVKENKYWFNLINSSKQLNEDPAKKLRYVENVKNVTIESVKAVANKYLNNEKLFKFILLPEDSK